MTAIDVSAVVSFSMQTPGVAVDFRIDNVVYAKLGADHTRQQVQFEICPISHRTHVLDITLSGKTQQHITMQNGLITDDLLVSVLDLRFDGVSIDSILHKQAIYHHDHNGHSDSVHDRFYGSMGCNGCVQLQFRSPVYLWLLDNM
jgi:hypothetical protein